jgi:hypothetical protein
MTKWTVVGATVTVALAFVGAPAALAAPTGGYAVFAQCPTHAVQVDGCLYAPVEGGYLMLGTTVVPIAKTVVVQGGLLEEEEPSVKHVAGALNGETLTKVGLAIPGGLFGLPLDAVAELAAPASAITVSGVWGASTRLAIPVKIRLANHLLGAECLLGSNSHPIEIDLTSGTSGGLTGNPGKRRTLEEGGILLKSGVSMVGSGFVVPKASGCGSAVVDEALDAKLGLPSSNNRIVFNLKMEIANSELVVNSEG